MLVREKSAAFLLKILGITVQNLVNRVPGILFTPAVLNNAYKNFDLKQ
jgi:hypothetical protein